jgi:CpXC protein
VSIQHRHVLACPHCKTPIEGRLFDSLNASRHPHFRELLLTRRLHRFECAGCGNGIEIDKSLLYVDFDRHQFIGCVPSAERREARRHGEALVGSFERTVRQGPDVVSDDADKFLVRIAFGYEELREKVIIDHLGLYDLAIEALKAQLIAAEPWFQAENVVTLSLDGTEPDGRLRFVPIWLLERRSQVEHTVWVERRLYDAVLAEHSTILDRYPRLASGPHVSLLRLAFTEDAGG